MRIIVFGDLHAHGAGLDALLAALKSDSPDLVICLGDVANIGPQPKEVLEQLRQLDCRFVMGNHDLALLNPDEATRLRIAPILLPTLAWTRSQLDQEDLAFIATFSPSIQLEIGPAVSASFYHGSPKSVVDNILPTTSSAELDQLFGEQFNTLMVGGHTHIQMLRQYQGTLIVNPGSIGNGFHDMGSSGAPPELLPWIEYAIIECAYGNLDVILRRLPFNLEAHYVAVRASGLALEMKSWWLSQYRSRA